MKFVQTIRDIRGRLALCALLALAVLATQLWAHGLGSMRPLRVAPIWLGSFLAFLFWAHTPAIIVKVFYGWDAQSGRIGRVISIAVPIIIGAVSVTLALV